VSANEAAEALFFITSAGLRGAGATEVLEASLKGAAIGLGDTKTIADLATSAVNAYGEATWVVLKRLMFWLRLCDLESWNLLSSLEAMGQVLPLASNLGCHLMRWALPWLACPRPVLMRALQQHSYGKSWLPWLSLRLRLIGL
jgi:hypothetical protein